VIAYKRICIRDWSLTAENGDHFEVKWGEIVTTSSDRDDGTCSVFKKFWVPVPIICFAGSRRIGSDAE
jgi:hypothetical protein